ncbi:hypothetical protein [Sphingomonas sp. LaA6.9]|uniref:hypothetical protein n=1 Tax=Sphingomonas sp. LaA6.9 TaxID=2919914 RepID=UPI001F4F595F|nr:hypothetical protein [Sphingomonas sp. LaA6.9]MCJ8158994.1 hypothetical protein [Sphingomonas sp. LaA6.9]
MKAALKTSEGRHKATAACTGRTSMQSRPLGNKLMPRGYKVVVVGGYDAGGLAMPLDWQRIQLFESKIMPRPSVALRNICPEQATVLERLALRGKLDEKSLIKHRLSWTRSPKRSRRPMPQRKPPPCLLQFRSRE